MPRLRDWASSGENAPLGLGGESSNANRLDGSKEFAVGLIGIPPNLSSSIESEVLMGPGDSVGALTVPFAILKKGPVIPLGNEGFT